MKNFVVLIIALGLLSCTKKTEKEQLISLRTELESIKSCNYDLAYHKERLNSDRVENYSQHEIIHCEIPDSIFGYKWSKLAKYGPMHYDGLNIVQLFPEQKKAWCDTIKYVSCPLPISPGIIQIKSLINYSIENFNDCHIEVVERNDTILFKFRYNNLKINFHSMTPFENKADGDTTFCALYLNKNLEPLRLEHKQNHQFVSNTFENFEKINAENKDFNALENIPIDFKRKPIYN